MSKVVRLKKGLDIHLAGGAEKVLVNAPLAQTYAVKPSDFEGVTPKMLVKTDEKVKAGTPLFFDKNRPQLIFSSPVSGTVIAVNRGEKRKILEVVITPDGAGEALEFETGALENLTREKVVSLMLQSGLWPMLIQRPYGMIADASRTPKAIFVSGFDSAPLAPDMDFVLTNQDAHFIAGMEILKKLTPGKVNLGISDQSCSNTFSKLDGIGISTFKGAHPAGNPGIQIHHIDPINKGETVWTIDPQQVIILGKFFVTGKVDMTRIIALTGSEVKNPKYYRIHSGASIKSITDGNVKPRGSGDDHIRFISGNVLTGKKVEPDGYIGFYSNQLTLIPEGDKYQLLGWIAPNFNKFSMSKSYFSWLCPRKKYRLDTNMNGGERSFVLSGYYEKVLPMDIYPVYLLKAILAGDIDKMEQLGIYEVIEEDMALCEFICPSKIEVQQIVRQGINQMIKELD